MPDTTQRGRDDLLDPMRYGSSVPSFQLMNIVPNPAKPTERWSDAPGFKGARIVPTKPVYENIQRPAPGPGVNVNDVSKWTWDERMPTHPGTNRVISHQFELMMDPEKHIERTSNYPGATGHDQPLERAMMDSPPPYGGSTDARKWMQQSHMSTPDVWEKKGEEVSAPKDATEYVRHPLTGQLAVNPKTMLPERKPVHGRGMLDTLMSGEDIRSPAHMIIDPEPTEYGGAMMLTTPGGQHQVAAEIEDTGGFGHDQPVQWEGHHRVKAAAMKQQKLRESGVEDWSVPVPYQIHFGTQAAMEAKPGIMIGEHVTEQKHKARKKRLEAFHGMLAGGLDDEPDEPPTAGRRLGGGGRGAAAGTWNSKMY